MNKSKVIHCSVSGWKETECEFEWGDVGGSGSFQTFEVTFTFCKFLEFKGVGVSF